MVTVLYNIPMIHSDYLLCNCGMIILFRTLQWQQQPHMAVELQKSMTYSYQPGGSLGK